ncbi:PREDICTED: SITS-binding protein-like [Chaetura pelagica]|uniref:SITS-binding protein-like n=1 Tax=Chaetura pelagica TaxID=8897 RepID=UPI0005238E9B|nr:PREDICTED: SITS-binding protein-like [Chaetura pelagica]
MGAISLLLAAESCNFPAAPLGCDRSTDTSGKQNSSRMLCAAPQPQKLLLQEDAELRVALEQPPDPATECYSVRWTPLRPDVRLKDCFSMANVSWFGGGGTRAPRWPLNGAESQAQPFVSGDLGRNPGGFGPVLDRYFLGSTVRSLRAGRAGSWLSLQPCPGGCSVPLLTMWKGQLCARLNVTSEEALSWYLARAQRLQQQLGATYVVFEGAEGNTFLEQALPPPAELQGDRYTQVLAAALATLGNATVISAGTRSSHLPLFIQMSPLRSDWSHAGLKGLIPSVLHYSLLGYNFFIPDAVGGSLAGDTPGDPELYVRWLQIVTFLPVMAFSTPPWVCCDTWVLVAPVTERGHTWRDIYLPGAGHLWRDTSTARLFDGGTILRNYSAGLTEVPVFVKTS